MNFLKIFYQAQKNKLNYTKSKEKHDKRIILPFVKTNEKVVNKDKTKY